MKLLIYKNLRLTIINPKLGIGPEKDLSKLQCHRALSPKGSFLISMNCEVEAHLGIISKNE